MTTHDISRAINIHRLPTGFMAAAQQAWCRETCWPGCVANYPENRDDNPALGNGLVTVLAAWAARGFEDEIIASKVNERHWHFRLGLKGGRSYLPVDPTWQQFGELDWFRPLSCDNKRGREEYREVIEGSFWGDQTLTTRLQLLLERMKSLADYEPGYSAGEIVDRLQQRFNFVRASGFTTPPPPPGPLP